MPLRRLTIVLLALTAACGRTAGQPVTVDRLGFPPCGSDRECGSGRYCHPDGYCSLQCRTDDDCHYRGQGLACDPHGRCQPDPAGIACTAHDPCGIGGYCNRGLGRCAGYCRGLGDCAAACQADPGCAAAGGGDPAFLTCTPGGLCIREDDGDTCRSHAECGPGRNCNLNIGLCAPYCSVLDDCRAWCAASDRCTSQCEAGLPNCPSLDGSVCCSEPGDQLSCASFGQCVELELLALPPDDPDAIDPGGIDLLGCPLFDHTCLMLGFGHHCGPDQVCRPDPDGVDFGQVDPAFPAARFAGVWGAVITTATISTDVPIYGVQRVYSHKLELIRVTHRGDVPWWEHKVCWLNVENFNEDGSPVATPSRILSPPEYLRGLEIVTHPLAPVADWQPGVRIASETIYEPRGWSDSRLDDGSYDRMPDEACYLAGDRRIYDQDKDGHPGMTNIMDGVLRGQIYNVSLMRYRFDGEVVDDDRVRGLVREFKNDINNIDASKPILVQNVTSTVHPDENRTFFRMIRLPDHASCADVIELSGIAGHWLSRTWFVDDAPLR